MRLAIDVVLADPDLGLSVCATGIGVVGHSIGAYTPPLLVPGPVPS